MIKADQGAKNIILLTIDCLRGDRSGSYMGQLAQESLAFERAITAGSPTYYAFPALLASRSPLALGRDVVGLAPEESTLATALKAAGYTTAAFLAGNPYLSPRFGYHQGFDVFEDFLTPDQQVDDSKQEVQPDQEQISLLQRANRAVQCIAGHWLPSRRLYNDLAFHYGLLKDPRWQSAKIEEIRQYPAANEVIDAAMRWLRHRRAEPFFLWIHLMDPHHPYYPPAEALAEIGRSDLTPRQCFYLNETWKRGNLPLRRLQRHLDDVQALYGASVHWADAQIGRLIEELKTENLWQNTVFALTSDHGEEFLEHGGRYHYPDKLTQELIHVPLMIHHPGHLGNEGQSRVENPFSLIDLAPTLLEMVNIAPPETFVGQSRWDGSRINDYADGVAITECVYDCRNPWQVKARLGPRLLAVQDQRYKLVLDFTAGKVQVFDLKHDPGEKHPLPTGTEPKVRHRLLETALSHVKQTHPDLADRRRLRARLANLEHRLLLEE